MMQSNGFLACSALTFIFIFGVVDPVSILLCVCDGVRRCSCSCICSVGGDLVLAPVCILFGVAGFLAPLSVFIWGGLVLGPMSIGGIVIPVSVFLAADLVLVSVSVLLGVVCCSGIHSVGGFVFVLVLLCSALNPDLVCARQLLYR